MARKKEDNLRYFSLDTDFFYNRHIKILRAERGNNGVIFYIYLLCEIYGKKGYYIEYDDDMVAAATADLGIPMNEIRQIIAFLLKRSMLVEVKTDETSQLFKSDKVITSRSIQLQYQESTKNKGRQRCVEVLEDLWVLKKEETAGHINVVKNQINTVEKPISTVEKAINTVEMAQIKLNKNKLNNNSILTDTCHPKSDDTSNKSKYDKIIDYWNTHVKVLPSIRAIKNKRRSLVRARIKEYGESGIFEMIDKVAASDFLKGNNQRGWSANFDWCIGPTNFPKVLEGNYDNKDKGVPNYYEGDDTL